MPLFVGEFEQSIDAKHRMAVPSALREGADGEEDGENYFLVLGPDRRLWMYPDKYYRRLIGSVKRSPLPGKQAQGLGMLLAMARVVKPDKQGRVVLPEKSLRRAGLDETKDVVLAGKGDHVEIWDAEEWERQLEEALPNYSELLMEAADRLELADD